MPHGPDNATTAPRAYWRSLEEYAQTPEFRAWAEREFPEVAWEQQPAPSRRRFLQLMGASLALAGVGLSGCRREEKRIVPYSTKPQQMILGQPIYYASTHVHAGVPCGILVETHQGRPTKIEGNPLHPNSFGATTAWAQASVLDLYDPGRSRTVLHQGQPSTFEAFAEFVEKNRKEIEQDGGRGVAILCDDSSSAALDLLRERLKQTLPNATWHQASGEETTALYALEGAEVIFTLDCDFLGTQDHGVRYKREFAAGRRVGKPGDRMSRLYVVEAGFSVTGAAADHRLRLPASQMHEYGYRLSNELAKIVGPPPEPQHFSARPEYEEQWITKVATDLAGHRGRCAVLGGTDAATRDVVSAINQMLGNVGKTVRYVNQTARLQSLQALRQRLSAGEVRTLVILESNPVYAAPVDFNFAELLKQVPLSIHLGLHEDETSKLCTWHLPAAHYLERWDVVRDVEGTISPIQPMIDPLFGGTSPLELLALLGHYGKDVQEQGKKVFRPFDGYQIAREAYGKISGTEGDFEERWRMFLHEGVSRGTGFQPVRGSAEIQQASATRATGEGLSPTNLELRFVPDSSVYDGRYANNGWLQECPDPMTKLVWDNAALLSPTTAKALQVQSGDVVRIEHGGRSITIPTYLVPGMADYSITLPLGYGRKVAGILGQDIGVDVNPLRTSAEPYFVTGATVQKTGNTYRLGTTHNHWAAADHHVVDQALKERAIVREGTLEEFSHHPEFAQHMGVHTPKDKQGIPLTIYTPPTMGGPQQWGMAIDLNTCVGCNACVIACQAENNIPIVGKDEVLKGREMHWLRLDRYFHGEDPYGEVEAVTQPMLCQHCESAPCEPVCPVNATVHSPEGLNEMVYNRCVGTRYCSNNCPYKVRRFNFFDYNKGTIRQSRAPLSGKVATDPTQGFTQPQLFQPPMQELLKMQKNPDVTVRMRGVMEKCTYCVQRIEQAKIAAASKQGQQPIAVKEGSGENRANHQADAPPAVRVEDGAIQTACQQSCPTQAIVFGDISDPTSRVSQLRNNPRGYPVLEHLNTRPRTTYLARVRNVKG